MSNNPVKYVDPSGYAECLKSKEGGAQGTESPVDYAEVEVKTKGGGYSGSRPTEGQGFSKKGYNPKPGERTFDGYVKNNVSVDVEVSLNTGSSGFNNNSRGVGGEFKRFGSDSHGGLAPHVHQPIRNVNPKIREIYGGTFNTSTKTGGVRPPSAKDIKQLYQHLFNGKY